MSSFSSPDLLERRKSAAAVKKAMLENFRDLAKAPHSKKATLKGSL